MGYIEKSRRSNSWALEKSNEVFFEINSQATQF